MNKKRIGAALLAAVTQSLTLCQMPLSAKAAQLKPQSLADFTAAVQKLTALDADRELFSEIVYDKAAGTLSADGGEAEKTCGNLSVRGGELMLKTGQTAGGISVQSGSAYEPFDEAAAGYGYTAEDTGDTVTITNEFQTARLIVKAAGSIDPYGAVSAAEGYNDLHILQYADTAAAFAAYQRYQADPAVQYVQPSHRIQLDDPSVSDADICEETAAAAQKQYMTWGAEMMGTDDFIADYLDAEVLPDVTVAVIDTGINPVPALFAGRILGGGINISDSGDDSVNDDLFHGTHVSGTICELTPPNVKILPIKVFSVEGTASDEQIYLGLMFALEQKADILNMSFGGLGVSPLEVEAMAIADEHGIICCAASGNNGDDAGYYYPGSIDSCITVGAVDQDMQRAAFSNYGKLVDVVAPGVGIVSYVLGDAEETEAKNGTSMATPHVSACCALLRSYDKTISPRRAEALLRLNAVDLGPEGFDRNFAWGFVNMSDFRWDDGICPAPELSLKSGSYGRPQTVKLTTDLPDAAIYYTTDSSVPTPETGILYTEPIEISQTTRLRAITVREGWITSAAAEGVYVLGSKDAANAYEVQDGVLLAYRGVRKTLDIPETVSGQTIRAIGAGAFRNNHVTEQITLPETVTEIGDNAFENCSVLKEITAPGVDTIGAGAFANDSALVSAGFADTLKKAGNAAFSGCAALTEFSAAGLTAVPDQMFSGCSSLTALQCPDAVVLGTETFAGCAMLSSLNVPWEQVTDIGEAALQGCRSYRGALRLPKLKTIGAAAFSGCSMLRRISLPDAVTSLPDEVLADCSALRLVQLPGVTVIGERALAFQCGTDTVTELDYSRLTAVGREAFRGFRIGGDYDTTEFSSLKTLEAASFAGVIAGSLVFPQITAVPENAFADATVGFVTFENAASFASGSLTGCRAAVLTKAAKQIEPDAIPEEFWIVTLDEIPALEALSSYYISNEPFVQRVSRQNIACAQHMPAVLRMLAGGIGLTYQWYLTDGDTQTPLAGETSAAFFPDTSVCGKSSYLCIATDAGGKTEQAAYQVTVTEEEETGLLYPEQLTKISGAREIQKKVRVSQGGTYSLSAFGAVPVSGILTDAAGRPVDAFTHAYSDSMTVQLAADTDYYLYADAMWSGDYAVMLSAETAEQQHLTGFTATVEAPSSAFYSAGVPASVKVRRPDGVLLEEGKDYAVRVTEHNQYLRAEIYGIGAYCGYLEAETTVIRRIMRDTPVTVSIEDASDTAVYAFVPPVSGTYHYYATCAPGYAEESELYQRTGRYNSGVRYVSVRTSAVIADTPDGSGNIFAQNSYSPVTGYYFHSDVQLNAGQVYYILCNADRAAEYAVVLTQENYDLRKAEIEGDFYSVYHTGQKGFRPEIELTLDGRTLTEGVDYQRIDTMNDVPGKAKVTVVGMGLYYGTLEQEYTIYYFGVNAPEEYTELDTPVTVTGDEEKVTLIWFRAERGETPSHRVCYRVLNVRRSGSPLRCTMYKYDAVNHFLTAVEPLSGTENDYMLRNGTYCVAVSRLFADAAAKSEISVIAPYSLEEAVLTIDRAAYTGDGIPAPVTVTAPDGSVLEAERDYRIIYPDGHTLIGETVFRLQETERSYGQQSGSFEIYADLAEDAPLLTVGEHEVRVTLENRLAVYRVTAETEMTYTLTTDHVENTVLRVFSPEGEMLEQDFGNGTNAVKFTVPEGETRYVMVKFNGTNREGLLRFRLDTELHLLGDCRIEAESQEWTGEQLAPLVKFYDGETLLREGTDYRLRFTADDVNIGTATANYVGLGKYFGTLDVHYAIIAPDVLHMEDLEPFPLMMNHAYAPSKTDDEMLLYSYTPGIDTALNILVRDVRCKLTLQRYDENGVFQESMFFRAEGDMDVDLAAGETCYFLITATDISSWNQSFRLLLRDRNKDRFETYIDPEGGFTYRIAKDGSYAEAVGFPESNEPQQRTLQKEVKGVPVTHVPEAIFTVMPKNDVVIGYAGCAVEAFADRYHFIYQQAGDAETPPADGDLNGDGQCTPADAVLLAAALAEYGTLDAELLDLSCCDLNADGLTNLMDLRLLLQRIPAQEEAPA